MISDSEMERRVKAIEKRVSAKPGAGTFRILHVGGCLPGPINHAYAGTFRWDRAEGEEFDAFVTRSARAALASGEMVLNVGGLPRGDELARFATFEEWWATVAPFYSDVPDCELTGYQRASPVTRAIIDR